MKTLTHFHNFARQQLWDEQQKVLFPQMDKVTSQQKHIYPQETVGIGSQIAKGFLVVGGTVCSALAIFALFGKKVEELKSNAGMNEERIGRSLLAIPEVKTTLASVSTFPTNPMPVTAISIFNLFFDSDGQSLTLDVVEKGKQTIPSWMELNDSTYGLLGACITTGAQKVHVVENLAYVADNTGGLQIIDVSNPSSPTLKGSYDTPTNAEDVYVVGNLAYVNDLWSLEIIDVSNPNFPTLIGSYDTPDNSYGVHVVGNFAYITGYSTGLYIIDVSNPSSPTLKGTYDTPGNAFGVYVVGNLAYVADSNIGGLQIIDVSNPISPIFKGSYDTPGYARDVYVVGNLAYVAEDAGLQIIDVSNPSAPIFKGTYSSLSSRSVDVVGNLAYVTSGNGLQVIDVSNPNLPTLKGTYDTPNIAYGVHVFGGFAYVASDTSGLQIIEQRFMLSGTPNQAEVGNYEIELIAKDSDQNQVSQSFLVRVEGPPVASGTIPNQLINVDTPFNYFIDQNAFFDPNDDIVFYSSKLANQNPLPSWLSFSAIGIFSGNPQSSDVGSYAIKVLAFDGIAPQQAQTTFSLIVDHFPEVATTIPDHAADIGKFYNYTVPNEIFSDADTGDVLTYNATLSNGNPLPSWLTFNAPLLSGTPNTTNAGSLSIQLSATDLAGAIAQTTFTLNVEHFPDLVNSIPNQLASIGKAFAFVIPSNTYSDLDGDPLIYKATKSDGSILPRWLGFSALRQEFQGTPLASDKGLLELKVIAVDPKGGQAATTFNLNVVDDLGTEIVRIGGEFVYAIPNDMITNPQGPITYTATLNNGAPLPAWLTFDPDNGIISGIPPSNSDGEYTLLVTAGDGVQTPVLGTLNLQVGINAAPQVANFISNQVAQVNQNFRFVVPDNTFIDPNGDSLTLNALRANGLGLPKWLKFDGASRTLEGKPGRGATGAFSDKTVPLQICATDGNEKACSIFDLSVLGTSNEERALAIFGPLASAAGLGLAWYKKRGLFVNPFNQNKYDKGTKHVTIGKPFNYKLEAEVNKIKIVQAFEGKRTFAEIPVPKSLDEKGWFEWLKHDKPIRGGQLLPNWLEYDERTNELTSHNSNQEDAGLYVVRVYGHGDVILEEIKLDVGGQGSQDLEMHEYK